MDSDRLDHSMGDDGQEDEVREYERYIEDPPRNRIIRELDDQGSLGITRELQGEWTRRAQASVDAAEDHRPAEVAAMEIVDEPT